MNLLNRKKVVDTRTNIEKLEDKKKGILGIFSDTVSNLAKLNEEIAAEEEAKEFEIQDAAQRVVTLEDEASNLKSNRLANDKIMEKITSIFS